jgi:amino acid permease
MNKKINTIVAVLAILLILAVGYITYGFYGNWKQEKDFGIYQEGAQLGYEQAVAQLFQGAAQCQQVPVTYMNQTINIIAVECLQAQAG